MFRLTFFVEDKNLPKVLHAVQGLALNMEVPQPVVNGTAVNGKVKAVSSGSTIIDRMVDSISAGQKGQALTSNDLREIIVKCGGQSGSIGTYSSQLLDRKVLKRKARGEYITLEGKE